MIINHDIFGQTGPPPHTAQIYLASYLYNCNDTCHCTVPGTCTNNLWFYCATRLP